MHILVTGCTGFVGSHTVAALINAGHTVRVLVRSPHKLSGALEPIGVSVDKLEVVEGSLTDRSVIDSAVKGCSATVHAAAHVSLEKRDEAAMWMVNVEATRALCAAAIRHQPGPFLTMSSLSAYVPFAGTVLKDDAPPGAGVGPYSRSKAAALRDVVRFQASGAPVVSVAPGGIWGPHDPGMGDLATALQMLFRFGGELVPKGNTSFIDVRDLASCLVKLVEAGPGSHRYVLAGHEETIAEFVARARFDGVPQMPMSAESFELLAATPVVDDAGVRAATGVIPRPMDDTMKDTIAWLLDAGIIESKHVNTDVLGLTR
jgi:nucleoside-diphosphate-sugar epimerase